MLAAAHVSEGFVMKQSLSSLLRALTPSLSFWFDLFTPPTPPPLAHPLPSFFRLMSLSSPFIEVHIVKVVTHTHTEWKVAQTFLAET